MDGCLVGSRCFVGVFHILENFLARLNISGSFFFFSLQVLCFSSLLPFPEFPLTSYIFTEMCSSKLFPVFELSRILSTSDELLHTFHRLYIFFIHPCLLYNSLTMSIHEIFMTYIIFKTHSLTICPVPVYGYSAQIWYHTLTPAKYDFIFKTMSRSFSILILFSGILPIQSQLCDNCKFNKHIL